ncbi:MAG TPA: ATP-binding protein [Vicinamibacterales bacterium]|nr:ATP-binding protein [Vicinamibacterales bacterium]
MQPLLVQSLRHEADVVTARQLSSFVAAHLGFDASTQTRIATAVSEIVRNAWWYARNGRLTLGVDLVSRPQRLLAIVEDDGPGIEDLQAVLDGRTRSGTGLGVGLAGARRLVDHFSIASNPNGTRVTLQEDLPAAAPPLTADRIAAIEHALRTRRPDGPLDEVQRQNAELLRALDELQHRQDELLRLNRELEDTNRGVVALYAELDDRALHLREADAMKSRFLSNMSHEFRTPVNSILGLCRLLADARAREGREPEPELRFIADAAEHLRELVDDLLDLARTDAGKAVVRTGPFDVATLFSALRGMLRPLLVTQSVALVFDAPAGLPLLDTDEAKVAQILRNLISNALKFTERGEVRVAATPAEGGRAIVFTVADTGIGIAPEDQARIFDEFAQLEHRLGRAHRGTGLGLPLSRRLAEILGGTLTVESRAGSGSTFTLRLPVRYGLQ